MAGVSERIQIIVSQTGAVTVKKDIESIGEAGKKSAAGIDMLKGVLATIISVQTLSSIVKYADTWTEVQNKLRLVTKDSEELGLVTSRLQSLATMTRSSYEGLATVYARTARTGAELGYTTEEMLGFTRDLGYAVAVSGSSADEATNALRQLAQGMASGALRGDELNSVLENLPVVANTIAAGMGVPIGALRELAKQGEITPAVIIAAFEKMGPALQAQFATTLPTIGQALQVLSDQFLFLVGRISEGTGVFTIFAQAIMFVAVHLDMILLALSPVAIALTVLAVQTIGGMVIGAFSSLTVAILAGAQGLAYYAGVVIGTAVSAIAALSTAAISATGWLIAMSAAALANPYILLAIGIAAVTAAVALWAMGFESLRQVWAAVQAQISAGIDWIASKLATLGIISEGTLKIILDADDPAAKLGAAFSNGGSDVYDKILTALGLGGTDAAAKIAAASAQAAQATKAAHDAGGKSAGEQIKKGATDGGKTAGEAVKKGATDGGANVAKSMTGAGTQAGKSMENSIKVGGVSFGKDVYNAVANAGDRVGRTIAGYMDAEIAKLRAETGKLQAEAAAIRKGSSGGSSGGSSSSSGGSSSSGSTRTVETFKFGLTDQGYTNLRKQDIAFTETINSMIAAGKTAEEVDKYMQAQIQQTKWSTGGGYLVRYLGAEGSYSEAGILASPHKAPEKNYEAAVQNATRAQQEREQQASTPGVNTADAMGYSSQPPVQIVNRMDPTTQLEVLDTSEGHRVIMNVIKHNRQDIRAVLGTP